jgi:Xaa-Pro aminopeptidase
MNSENMEYTTGSSEAQTTDVEARLRGLRAELQLRNLAALLVPKSDEYILEYSPPCWERLAWLTGFTGSAGMAVVGQSSAALFIDGRYTTQAARQVQSPAWERRHLIEDPPASWIKRTLRKGDRLGYDPRIQTPANLEEVRKAVARVGAELVPLSENLIDRLWTDRPAEPCETIELYPEAFAGDSSAAKRRRIAAELVSDGEEALIVSAPECLAWLLNIRGADIPYVPLALGRAIVRCNGGSADAGGADPSIFVYMDPRKIPAAVRANLEAGPAPVTFAAESAFESDLSGLSGKRVRVDEGSASDWLVERLRALGAIVQVAADPCTLAKACKSDAELKAIRAAHVRDGAALVRFLRWLSEEAEPNSDEWALAEKLAEFRAGGENYRGPSFDTISAFGPSSALPHYRVHRDSALRLESGNLYLVDSGGQYLDGTTDVTRVTAVGEPSQEMRRRYTQVLKGHIAIARARFPAGTTGSQLDALARQFLWQDGVDFDHGTGHGVGCYLSVHEGPQGISKRHNKAALKPGMVVSNEPGYYKAGAFGIRIENLVAVRECSPQPAGAERTTLGFETLTLVPYERRLIDTQELTASERSWVDAYHGQVCDALLSRLGNADAAYLRAATAPLQ